jgi:hypothetical protein
MNIKKTYNILKNDFTKSILKNRNKKSIFLMLEQTHPKFNRQEIIKTKIIFIPIKTLDSND